MNALNLGSLHQFAVTADIHFALQSAQSESVFKGYTTRLHDRIECFEWMCNLIKKRGVNTLFVLGDFFDSRTNIPIPVLQAAKQCLQYALDECGITVVILAGNHDAYLSNVDVTSVSVFDNLRSESGEASVRVVTEPTIVWLGDGPWPKNPLEGAGLIPWRETVEELQQDCSAMKERGINRIMVHSLFNTAAPSDTAFDPDDVPLSQFSTVLAGDVHEPQCIDSAQRFYVGAPMQYNYSDAGGERGFYLVRPSQRGEWACTYIPNDVSPRFHKVEGREDTQNVGAKDYARVVAEDAGESESIVGELKSRTRESRIESLTPPKEQPGHRLHVDGESDAQSLVHAYLESRGIEDSEYERIGVRILESGHGSDTVS